MSFRFINPVQVTDANFTSSTVPETDYAAWSSGTTYTVGDRVIKTSTHRIYESVQAGNIGHDPATDVSATWWVSVAPTNRWAMFDATVDTVTHAVGDIAVVIQPGAVTALALLDVKASDIQVVMRDGAAGPVVYDKTYDMLDGSAYIDWYAYFFDPVYPLKTLLVMEDLPSFGTSHLTITASAPSTTDTEIGTLAVGTPIVVGDLQTGARVGITDYSRKEVDQWGTATLVERAFAKRMDCQVFVRKAVFDYVARSLSAVRAIPIVWIAADEYSSLVIFGWLKDWNLALAYKYTAMLQVDIEGLT